MKTWTYFFSLPWLAFVKPGFMKGLNPVMFSHIYFFIADTFSQLQLTEGLSQQFLAKRYVPNLRLLTKFDTIRDCGLAGTISEKEFWFQVSASLITQPTAKSKICGLTTWYACNPVLVKDLTKVLYNLHYTIIYGSF